MDANQPKTTVNAVERLEFLTGAIQGTIVTFETIAADAANPLRATEFRTYANNLRAIVERWGAGRITAPATTHGRLTHPTRTQEPVTPSANVPAGAKRSAKSKRRVPTAR